jgi:hypothetical protein
MGQQWIRIPGRRHMRLDNRKTYLRNCSHQGFSKIYAKTGDLISYDNGDGRERMGRVMGRIAEIDRDGENISGQLLVMEASPCGTFGYDRPVHPESVHTCYAPGHMAFLRWMADASPEDLLKYAKDDLETRKRATFHGD